MRLVVVAIGVGVGFEPAGPNRMRSNCEATAFDSSLYAVFGCETGRKYIAFWQECKGIGSQPAKTGGKQHANDDDPRRRRWRCESSRGEHGAKAMGPPSASAVRARPRPRSASTTVISHCPTLYHFLW
jgi:hypothetical protein